MIVNMCPRRGILEGKAGAWKRRSGKGKRRMRKYSHISVGIPGNVFDLFLARVSDLAASRWRRDPALEETTGESTKGLGVSYVWYTRTDGPQTDVVFLYTKDQLTLSNVFTTGKGITHEEHELLTGDLWNLGMKQACQELGLAGTHTQSKQVKPEDGLPPGVAQALKMFGLGANKSTGSADPSDMGYWCRFLALLHVSRAEFDDSRLSDYLTEKKFPEEIVMDLLGQYEMAMTLLPMYDEMLKGKVARSVQ